MIKPLFVIISFVITCSALWYTDYRYRKYHAIYNKHVITLGSKRALQQFRTCRKYAAICLGITMISNIILISLG